MKKGWLGVAALGIGVLVLVGVLAYVLDHARASVRIVHGLGEAAEPEREQALAVPEGLADSLEAARVEVARAVTRPAALEVRVVDEDGKRVSLADVLAYRDGELLRAGHSQSGVMELIPFDGPATVRVELNTFEVARLEIPDGHGSYEVVLPRLGRVAGVVRVGGEPRQGIDVELVTGSEGGLGAWLAYGLEEAGLRRRPGWNRADTAADGAFHIDGLAPGWSGSLRPADREHYRLAGRARRLELARPEEGLVLELEPVQPELVIRGRATLAGEGVPDALWELDGRWGHCDELGRFTIHTHEDGPEGESLELSKPGAGRREIAVGGEHTGELGDVELLPVRAVAFVARTESGAPIAGARAAPRTGTKERHPFESLGRCSRPTGADGRGVLEGLRQGERELRVQARGYVLADVVAPEDRAEPVEVTLTRSASLQVVVRDSSGRVPRGLHLCLESREPPFTWANGARPEGDEQTPENIFGGGTWERERGYSGELWLDERGRAWIDALRPGVACDLSAVDSCGTVLASARGLALAAGEWRRVELCVTSEPRTLLVVVRDSLGRCLPNAKVKLWPPDGEKLDGTELWLDRAGMARSEPLYGDAISLQASARGFESRTLERVTVPREGATVEIRLAHDWRWW